MYDYELSTVFRTRLLLGTATGVPVFPSYSAYNSRLGALNVAHLASVNAP
jgi:hypothetical protein